MSDCYVQTAVRSRPLTAAEAALPHRSLQLLPPHRVTQLQYGAGAGQEQETRNFDVDFVFTPSDTNDKVSPTAHSPLIPPKRSSSLFPHPVPLTPCFPQVCASFVHPVIDRVLEGYNALILTYGSSGTGKGHSFHGTDSEPGLLLSAAGHLFRAIAASPSTSASLTLSAYHVQGNSLTDLLAPCTLSPPTLLPLPHPTSSPAGLAAIPFDSPAELSTLLGQLRATARALTLRAPFQPKPHLIIEWRLSLTRASTTHSTLTRFVSCAGSGGASLKFNPGLTALSQVVGGLAGGKAAWEVPFTASALTRLCEFGLAGAAYTAVLLCIDETEASHEDTAHALHLAGLLCKVPLRPQPQRSRVAERLAEVREDIAAVRGRLTAAMGVGGGGIDVRDVERLKRLCEELERVKGDTAARRAKEGERWRRLRVERLQKEGLAHVLLSPSPVPSSLLASAALLLHDVVQLQAAVDDAQEAVEAARATGGEAQVAEAVAKEAELRGQLDGVEGEYRQLMATVVGMEAEQRRVWRGAGDDAALSRYHRGHSWAEARRGMAADPALSAQLAALEDSAALIAQSFEGKAAAGGEGGAGMAADAGQLTAEWLEVSRQAAVAVWERDRLLGRVVEERVRAQVEREREREEALQLMTEYREQVEADKRAMEAKYRQMLSDSVHDALRWSEEAAQLRAQLEHRRR